MTQVGATNRFHACKSFALKRQKLIQTSSGTKEDLIYLSIFDWC